MHRLVFRNDRLLPLGEVNLSPGQAGLLNGWGLFTTMRIYDWQPFAFERHWQRLNRDAARIELPLRYPFSDVSSALRQVIESNAVQNGCARIYFIYNKVGFWSSDETFPVVDFLIYTNDLPTRIGPTVLGVLEHGRHAAHPLAGVKVTSWLENVWSLEQAHQRGFEEVILLNERNEVAECTAANVFLVRGGQLATPPLSSGCLAGVTREILLELAPELGLPVIQRPLTLGEVYQAEEVFITSSLREVQPVTRIEDHTVSQAPGPVTTRLAEAFSAFVGRSLARP